MNYSQALTYTHSLKRLGSTPGLACLGQVMEKLGNPQEKLSCIHVAGTNGKGSVCAFTASILQQAGYKVGLYTSPFLVDFRERFQINGQMIEEDTYARLAEKVKIAMEAVGEELSQFAFITAVAFCYFEEQNCDVVVLETGLGGRLDATNIIEKPLVTAITAIGLDHTELLGDTLEEIAREKCGIIKKSALVVLSPGQPIEVVATVMEYAAKAGVQVILPNGVQITETSPSATNISYGGQEYALSLHGEYQPLNAVTAMEIVKALKGFCVREEHIQKGLASAGHKGRCQVLRQDPLILLDGAHNPQGATALSATLTQWLGQDKAIGVCGVMSDKAAKDLAKAMGGHLSKLIAVTPHTPRALSAEKLAEIFAPYCPASTMELGEGFLSFLKNQQFLAHENHLFS
jgi:dihydrofolate synthase/folylpolyglutamate synthase